MVANRFQCEATCHVCFFSVASLLEMTETSSHIQIRVHNNGAGAKAFVIAFLAGDLMRGV